MGNKRGPIPAGGVNVLLLDSAQGQPIQTWRFLERREITIGREDGNDVVISDPHVSRRHATLVPQDDRWMLISQGRHGTLIDDRLVAEAELHPGMIFRLGPTGPMLRFDMGILLSARNETMDQIPPDLLDFLNVDEARKQQEVEQITSGELFAELKEETRRMKSGRQDDGKN